MTDSILNILQQKPIPWVESNGLEQIIVARQAKANEASQGFQLYTTKVARPTR